MLAFRAPARRPAANRFAAQRRFVFRADSLCAPAFVEQPAFGNVFDFVSDGAQSASRDKSGFAPKRLSFGIFERRARTRGCNVGTPKNFIGHPIANSRKAVLQKKRGLDGQPRMAVEESADRR